MLIRETIKREINYHFQTIWEKNEENSTYPKPKKGGGDVGKKQRIKKKT